MPLDELASESNRRTSLGGALMTEEVEVLAPEVAAARGLLSTRAQTLLASVRQRETDSGGLLLRFIFAKFVAQLGWLAHWDETAGQLAWDAAAAKANFDQIMGELEDERVEKRAQRYLRDLRNDAIIEYN